MARINIYQTKNDKYSFMGYDFATKHGFNFNKDYNLVYTYEDTVKSLDDVFTKFNLNRPADFKGHSLSVSDIVEIGYDKFYCDSFNWVKI